VVIATAAIGLMWFVERLPFAPELGILAAGVIG